jgi:sulfur-oxidizing protein SoxA
MNMPKINTFVTHLLLLLSMLVLLPTATAEQQHKKHDMKNHETKNDHDLQTQGHENGAQKKEHNMHVNKNGKNNKQSKHAGGHGGHGAIAKGIDKFPTIAYHGSPEPRLVDIAKAPKMLGNPQKGKHIAYSSNLGRCITCHVLDAKGEQAGTLGPNLSNYGSLNRTDKYTFQQVWDARAHNPETLMPPLGTNSILNKHQVAHVVAYLKTLKTPIIDDFREGKEALDLLVAGKDFTLADLFLEQGEALFNKAGKNGKSCSTCHQDEDNSLTGVAATFPKADKNGEIVGLEQQINSCRKNQMSSHPLKLGSPNSNHLSSYIKYLSRDIPIKVAVNDNEKEAVKRGEKSFYKKAGQLNFSCADCHAKSDGKWLRGQFLGSIKPEGGYSSTAATWPRHFIAGHDLGLISLQQRIRHCQIVTRTFPLKLGSKEYTEMELYITSLANNKPVTAPTKSNLGGD